MTLSRRDFAFTGLATFAFGGCGRLALAATRGESYRGEVRGYGPLIADPRGFFDLPKGFSYRVLSKVGDAMDDGLLVPDNFDGMGCLPLGNGRLALVRNHELSVGSGKADATGGDMRRLEWLSSATLFGRDADGKPMPGGTTTLVYDLRRGMVERQHLSLAGTSTNCAGGVTPWGSWLSCEETVVAQPKVERAHGWVFEVPAAARGLVEPVPLIAMGRFRHEAVAIDPATGIAYLTEDREDGLFYRFLPDAPGQLAKGGRLQALGFVDRLADTSNWNSVAIQQGAARAVCWIDLDHVESPDDDLRARGMAKGAARFARGEGIHLGLVKGGSSALYFTCTSGGQAKAGQIFRHVPGQRDEAGTLELFVESQDTALLDYGDNLTVAPNGHLIVCEDRKDNKINHLRGVTPEGKLYTLARLNADTELAGACFSPDGRILFVNAYSPGQTLAITGPWERVSGAAV